VFIGQYGALNIGALIACLKLRGQCHHNDVPHRLTVFIDNPAGDNSSWSHLNFQIPLCLSCRNREIDAPLFQVSLAVFRRVIDASAPYRNQAVLSLFQILENEFAILAGLAVIHFRRKQRSGVAPAAGRPWLVL
jgi:hypothetical protein